MLLLMLQTHVCGFHQVKKNKPASGVLTSYKTISFSFDFAVDEHNGLSVDFQRPSGIMQANATILIEI